MAEEKCLVIGNKVFLRGGKILSPGFIVITNGIIERIYDIKPEDTFSNIYSGFWITPGFIDIHNHGTGGGESVSEYWLSDYTTKTLPKYGTTSTLATVTFPLTEVELTNKVVSNIHEKCGKIFPGQAVIEGIHAEGPIIQSSGGLAESKVNYTQTEFEEFVKTLKPSLKIMTISPSLENKINYDRFKVLLRENIVPALGHDLIASEDDIVGALQLAFEHKKQVHITHMYNVSKIHHRDVSLVNFGLLSQYPKIEKYQNIVEPSVEIIGDLVHVHPLAIQLALQSKNHQNIAFVTDAIMDGDCDGSTVLYCDRKIMNKNKRVYLENTQTLAGSCTNLLDIFFNLVQTLKTPIEEVVPMLSENPARIAGLSHIGVIEEGKRADILLFSQQLQLSCVLVNGDLCWKNS